MSPVRLTGDGPIHTATEDGDFHGSDLYPPFVLPLFHDHRRGQGRLVAKLGFDAGPVLFGVFLLLVGIEASSRNWETDPRSPSVSCSCSPFRVPSASAVGERVGTEQFPPVEWQTAYDRPLYLVDQMLEAVGLTVARLSPLRIRAPALDGC